MGILNLTPDSFYAPSRVAENAVLRQAEQMLNEGATLLDIGGQSTRPHAEYIAEDTELQRVLPAIAQLHRHFPEAVISIDTFRAKVAEAAVAS